MIINLYRFTGDSRLLDKAGHLASVLSLSGTLKSQASIVNPIVTAEFRKGDYFLSVADSSDGAVADGDGDDLGLSETVSDENLIASCDYAEIPQFHRFYYVNDVISVREGLWQLSMSCDVLMSFKDEIRKMSAFVDRNENKWNSDLGDDRVSFTQEMSVSEDEFGRKWGSGFDPTINNPSFLLTILTSEDDTTPTLDITTDSPYLNSSVSQSVLPSTYVFRTIVVIGDEAISFFKWCQENSSAASFVLSLRMIPIHPGWFTRDDSAYRLSSIKVGDLTYSAQNNGLYVMRYERLARMRYSLSVPKKGVFTEYSPYSEYSLYLPYKGIVNLDSQLVVGRELEVDYLLGTAGADDTVLVTSAAEDGDDAKLLYSASCQIGAKIPLSTTNAQQIADQTYQATSTYALSYLGTIVGVLASVASGNPLPAIAGVSGTIASTVKYSAAMGAMHETASAQMVSGESSSFFPLTPILRIASKQPTSPIPASNQAARKLLGAPLRSEETLSSLTGLTICSAVRADSISGATLQERTEIEKNLLNGVIL